MSFVRAPTAVVAAMLAGLCALAEWLGVAGAGPTAALSLDQAGGGPLAQRNSLTPVTIARTKPTRSSLPITSAAAACKPAAANRLLAKASKAV